MSRHCGVPLTVVRTALSILSGGNGTVAYRLNGSAQRTGEYDTPEGKIPNSQSNHRSSFDPDGAAVERPDVTKRDFTNISASVGLLGYLRDDLTVALNLARAARNPSLEELYNFDLAPEMGRSFRLVYGVRF
jgi:hypothetical protein